MGIREKLNENPRLATGIALGLMGLTLILMVWFLWPRSPKFNTVFYQYYSDDDGASFYKDTADKLPPFKHNGREAVIAMVFRGTLTEPLKDGKGNPVMGPNGKQVMGFVKGPPFVGYLKKYTDQGKKKVEEILADKAHPERRNDELYLLDLTEIRIKKPGAGNEWIDPVKESAAAGKIKAVMTPDGQPARIMMPDPITFKTPE